MKDSEMKNPKAEVLSREQQKNITGGDGAVQYCYACGAALSSAGICTLCGEKEKDIIYWPLY